MVVLAYLQKRSSLKGRDAILWKWNIFFLLHQRKFWEGDEIADVGAMSTGHNGCVRSVLASDLSGFSTGRRDLRIWSLYQRCWTDTGWTLFSVRSAWRSVDMQAEEASDAWPCLVTNHLTRLVMEIMFWNSSGSDRMLSVESSRCVRCELDHWDLTRVVEHRETHGTYLCTKRWQGASYRSHLCVRSMWVLPSEGAMANLAMGAINRSGG